MKLGNKEIGYDQNPFFIAEIGINHNGDLALAKKLIDGAVEAGCDAVKFQKRTVDVVYTPEDLARPRENPFGPTNGDLKRGLEFGKKEYDEIDKYCRDLGIMWFASPWDEASVDFLEQYNPPAYKVASACNQDRELLERIKATGRPIIVSMGMTDEETMDKIVNFLGEKDLIIMDCVSTYPSAEAEMNLSNIPRMIKKYPQALIGHSGHHTAAFNSLVAATLGACVIERHITLDRAMWGSDQAASLEISGLNKLVKELKYLKTYLGKPEKKVLETEKPIEQKLRRKKTL